MGGKTVDLFMFMGQSNMAGRGIVTPEHPEPAPEPLPNAGYEYRAVSDPGKLVPISEPFGRAENRRGGIDDGDMKTGSMVTAFVNAYYTRTGVPVVGVSASKGGRFLVCVCNFLFIELHKCLYISSVICFVYNI